MSSRHRLVIKECLWVCGGSQTTFQRHAIRDLGALRERGAKIFVLKSHKDTEGLEQLGRLLRQTDDHVILGWMEPYKLAAIHPLIRERKNFSIMGDDWWPYGVEKNRTTLDALCEYSYEQGLSARPMAAEELFAPETLDDFKI